MGKSGTDVAKRAAGLMAGVEGNRDDAHFMASGKHRRWARAVTQNGDSGT
jgi:hypothetical protein